MKLISQKRLLKRIRQADCTELNEIISVVEEHFRDLWPEHDLLLVSSEGRRPEDHIRALQNIIRISSHFVNKNDLP